MAVIKNKRELVLRARAHARQDHIVQGTYGNATVNGGADYQGCAIGCLSTPHRKRDLVSFLRGFKDPKYGLEGFGSDDRRMLRDLRREFGIIPELARVVEAIFEGLDLHGAAIEFIPEFAEALPEGVNIAPRHVRAIWNQLTIGRRPALSLNYLNDVPDADAAHDAFLAWLRNGARVR